MKGLLLLSASSTVAAAAASATAPSKTVLPSTASSSTAGVAHPVLFLLDHVHDFLWHIQVFNGVAADVALVQAPELVAVR